jgi:DNA helicase-2/ATP-dependent DNA helicase PcrA
MDILSSLNPVQQEAVKIIDGPVLVLAGPGSGKTRVLTHRVAYLIGECRIAPYNILAVTFTNKAAREMRERLVKIVGEARTQDLTIGTFHATCARFLRRDGERIGLSRGFVIYDDDDQNALMKQILREMNLDDKKYKPGAVLGAIGKAKNELIEPDAYVPASYWHEVVGRVYKRYQQLLSANNAADFDDLLMATVRLLRDHSDVLSRYQERYRYLHVDEFQDTNIAQYELMKLLADKYQNLFCVGDEDQCLPGNTKIQTPDGIKSIETIRLGDSVTVGAGHGHTTTLKVERVHRRNYRGRLVEIQTQRGHTLRVTPNHILFARLGISDQIHYVYLMYRADRGYRIGIAFGTRSDGVQLFSGLAIRCRQEHADKVWVLRVCRSKSDAEYWENYFAFKYGIPTILFHGVGRGLALSEEKIAHLYNNLDTAPRAAHLMADLQLFPEFPHFRPKAVIRGPVVDRKIIHFKMFGDSRRTTTSPWGAHRVSINTTDIELKRRLRQAGYHTRTGRRETWRVERSNLDYDAAENFVCTLAQSSGNVEISRSAFFSDTQSAGGITLAFDFQPASHIHPTMILPVFENGKIIDDVVVRVDTQEHKGFVYDLNIPKVHNYIANGIVVHNSIYGWRGADYRNVLRFSQDFPNAQVRLLEQNYRSTQTILDVAQAVIKKNPTRHEKELWTENPKGIPITILEAYDQDEEASFVVDEIARLAKQGYSPRDCAVFYRTNFQSRVIESAFTRRGMPYQLVGSLRFYQRREVKDILAYLRLIANPDDSVAFNRVLNVPPRGIGKNTMDNLARWSQKLNKSPYQVLQMLKATEDRRPKTEDKKPPSSVPGLRSIPADAFDNRARKSLVAFVNLIDELRAARTDQQLTKLTEFVLQKTAYADYLVDGTREGEERWDNVRELLNATKKYSGGTADTTLTQFLEEAALIADIDTMRDDVNAPTLMTLHTAKGLEFRVVFIVGLEEGLFPHSRSFDEPAQMEEERRLCYVGITRAKERLYLLRTFRRAFYGNAEPSEPSRYLADIPRHLITGNTKPALRHSSYRHNDIDADAAETSAHRSAKPALASRRSKSEHRKSEIEHRQFNAGDKVSHPSFGDGVVVASKMVGTDEEVQIAFAGIGVKRLIARYANLRKK